MQQVTLFFTNEKQMVAHAQECTMFLSYYSIFVELVGPSDDMDRAMLKCNLLNINDYVQEFKGILLSLGFRL